jgi:hypothetical protein
LLSPSALFFRQDGDVDAIDPRDVQQKDCGDCALMATLAALASSPKGRAVIRSAITENKNDKGEVTSYTVRLYKFGLLGQTPSPVDVKVDGQWMKGHAEVRDTLASFRDDGVSEVWPLVFEHAYAALRGGHNQICRGDLPTRTMEAVTGLPAHRTALTWGQTYAAEQLERQVADGKLVVLETRSGIESPQSHGLLDSHAYQVTGTEVQNGTLYLKLHNPWNKDEPDLVPFGELNEWFAGVDVGSVD